MPERQPPRTKVREPLEMVAFHAERVDLGAAMMMMAIPIVMPIIMSRSRLFPMLTTSIRRHLMTNWMDMRRTDDADIQAGHHAKHHQPGKQQSHRFRAEARRDWWKTQENFPLDNCDAIPDSRKKRIRA
jgi:hypothetical protein